MTKLTQSYVHGASSVPLIGETLGVHFDKVATRWADRDALIARRQSVRWSKFADIAGNRSIIPS